MREGRMIVLVAVVLLVAASAQAGLLPVPTVAVKAGANFSKLNTDNLDASTRTGLVGGLALDVSFVAIHLSPELLLTQKGFKDGNYLGGPSTDYRSLNLEIPLLFRYAIPSPVVQPSLYVAPAVSFPLKSELQETEIDEVKAWSDVKDQTKSTVFSLIVGAGLQVQHITFDLRYEYGLTNYLDGGGADTKDRTVTAMVGYAFF